MSGKKRGKEMSARKSAGRPLWDKGEKSDDSMKRLTVGEDPVLDQDLITYDLLGSAAHARMLAASGYLKKSELGSLLSQLRAIADSVRTRTFQIPFELEDMHTAIENRLTEKCGAIGERIHTARSRNDQVLLAIRLFLRSELLVDLKRLIELLDIIETRFSKLAHIPMPGYTHHQPAMPSSVGLWLHAWYEGILETVRDGIALYQALNMNPLGAGAGFGTSLKIDREQVARLLGFSRAQRSVIDINNSRGRYEERFLRWGCDIGSILEKFACDMTLFTTREFGFFSLPNDLTTGSSIMPQKRNPDIVELLRGRVSLLRGYAAQLQHVSSKLPSSYHRDFQLTKGPTVYGARQIADVIEMAALIFSKMHANEKTLEASMYDDLYATYDANREVSKGISFREAYRRTSERVKSGSIVRKNYELDFVPVQKECIRYFKVAVQEKTRLIPIIQECESAVKRAFDALWHS